MPKYQITDNLNGKVVTVDMDQPPTDNDAEIILGSYRGSANAGNPITPQRQPQQKKKDLSFYDAMYPRLTKIEQGGKGNKAIATGLDILSMPLRAGASGIGTLADLAGTIASKGKPSAKESANTFTQGLGQIGKGEGQKGVEGLAEEIVRDPANLIPFGGAASKGKVLAKVGKGALSGLGSAAVHQGENIGRGDKVDPGNASFEVVLSALLPVAGKPIKKGVEKAGQLGNKLLGATAQELSGVKEEALRAFGLGFGKEAQSIIKNAKTEKEIANKLTDIMDNFENYIPEKKVVNEALQNMPPISFDKVFKTIDGAKVLEGSESAISANKRLENLKGIYTNLTNENGVLPAFQFREVRKQLDNEVDRAFAKDIGAADIFEQQAMKIRNAMKDALEESAMRSENPQYVDAMKTYSEKLNILNKLKGILGKEANTRERRAQSFVDNLLNRNKNYAQELTQEIGDIGGADLINNAKYAQYADELGITKDRKSPSLFPVQSTGRSTLGTLGSLGTLLTGLSTGNLPLAITGGSAFGLSSPKVASKVLGLTDLVGQGYNKLDQLSQKEIATNPRLEALVRQMNKSMPLQKIGRSAAFKNNKDSENMNEEQ